MKSNAVRSVRVDLPGDWTRSYIAGLLNEIAAAREHVMSLQQRNAALTRQLVALEARRARLEEHVEAIEQQNAAVNTFCAGLYRLHSTLVRAELLEAIEHVPLRLIGCREYRLYGASESDGQLSLLALAGTMLHAQGEPLAGGRDFEQALSGCSPVILEDGSDPGRGEATAIVPLRLEGRLVGAIVVSGLAGPKLAFEPVDRELLALLAAQAGGALVCARLYARERPTRRPPPH